MYKEKKVPELGGESGIRTAYFSDIQSWSTMSEKLTSKKLVNLLNEYLLENCPEEAKKDKNIYIKPICQLELPFN